jgi:phosphoadenosine phosphosulfate reductase
LTQNPAARVLVYDGVRAEESSARTGYDQISRGGKHGTQINVRPILKWNASEIFLYLFEREAFFNRAYRFGLSRVGCSVCPMASQWSESLNWLVSPENCLPLLEVLRDYYRKKDGECNMEAIMIGTWKARAGGRNILRSLKVVESRNGNLVKFTTTGLACDWTEWAKTIGQVTMTESTAGVITGPSLLLHFRYQDSGGHLEVEVDITGGSRRSVLRHLRAITNKTAYCCRCRACEVECPTGALKVGDSVVIDDQRCRNCAKCLRFVAKGCLVAKSLHTTGKTTR